MSLTCLFLLGVMPWCIGVQLLIPADSSLGRVDKSSFSQQTMMELLIANFTNREIITGSHEEHSYTSTWREVMLNGSGEVVEIDWSILDGDLNGSIDLQWLPPTLQRICLEANELSGSLDFTDLPPGLLDLRLAANGFSGEVSFISLPPCMNRIELYSNYLSGSISLSRLPAPLRYLYLQNNRFSGTLDLTRLPGKLEDLNLSGNSFDGLTDFNHLPESLRFLGIKDTKLSGEVITSGMQVLASGSKVKVLFRGGVPRTKID